MSRLTLWLGMIAVLAAPCRSSDQDLNSLTIEQLMQIKVEGAAMHPQTLEDAPASVTIITAEDIRKYGYRTLGEALAGVREFYVSNDRTYTSAGVRGFNAPGDYDSRLLVMVNGHNMTDNIFDFMLFFGNDFPIDMNLIKQIEIIRGPSSALYGSNAILATINVITKSPDEAGSLTMTADLGSFGEKKGQITGATAFGGVKVLFSGAVYNNTQEDRLFLPQFSTPQNNNGNAIDMNTEKGYHFFSNLTWRNWTVTAAFSDHDILQPVSWGNTIFNDRGTHVNDQRNFVDAAYERRIGSGTLRWRTYYDSYYCVGRFDYPLSDGTGVDVNRQELLGNWAGTQLAYRFGSSPAGTFTVGVEGKIDLRNLQSDADVSPVPVQYLSTSNRDRSGAIMVQDEKRLSERWTLDLGLRFDGSLYNHGFVSPRAALIYQRSDWTYKFLYGRGFRKPSSFQLFYDDGLSAEDNPALRPESADTVEVDAERKIGKRMNLQASGYGYRMHDFLAAVVLADGLLQYQNLGTVTAEGFGIEINGRPTDWLEAAASYAVQRSRDAGMMLTNSPTHLAKLRFAVPLGRKFDFSSGMRYQSSRQALSNTVVTPVYLADFTLTSKHMLRNFDVRMGLRNAFARKYSDPVALNPIVDSTPQSGRTFFVELIAHAARN